jgi:hypothetical protein
MFKYSRDGTLVTQQVTEKMGYIYWK